MSHNHYGLGSTLPFPRNLYRKKTTVEMVKMHEPFTCTNREGHNLQGQAGDYLAEDGHGGFYPISAEFHAANYECVDDSDSSTVES